ncbi:Gag-Pol polyprotein, partial [Bienertia sinuspersici]
SSKSVQGEYEVREPTLSESLQKIKNPASQLASLEVKLVHRENNAQADAPVKVSKFKSPRPEKISKIIDYKIGEPNNFQKIRPYQWGALHQKLRANMCSKRFMRESVDTNGGQTSSTQSIVSQLLLDHHATNCKEDGEKMRQWGLDLLGPFPKAQGGKRWLIVAIDYFSKWIESKCLVQITEKAVRKFIWQNVISRYRLPICMVMDQENTLTTIHESLVGSIPYQICIFICVPSTI